RHWFADPECEAARSLLVAPEEPERALEYTIQRTRALAASSRFLWPIPDRGLARRLHRIAAPTLTVWGRDDRAIAPAHAAGYREGTGDPRPVLPQRTAYGRARAWNILDPLRAVERGYVAVVQDGRGRYASKGEFTPFHDEIDDGYDTVEWCAAQPWSDGRVG